MKIKFFSRVTAVALTLAMLIPCLMTAPVSAADSAVNNIYRFANTKMDKNTREKIMTSELKTNVVYDYDKSTTGYNYPVQYARIKNLYTRRDPFRDRLYHRRYHLALHLRRQPSQVRQV